MGSNQKKTEGSLESRIFRNVHYLALVIVILLLVYDVFIAKDYISVGIEIVAITYFAANLISVSKRPSTERQHWIFSVFIALLVNAAWITGGGVSLLMATVFSLGVGFILVVNKTEVHKYIYLLVIMNYFILFIMEYFFRFNLSDSYDYGKVGLLKDYIVTLSLFMFGGYLIQFLKINYNKERSGLNAANSLLKEKSDEISDQNEELKTSKEALDKTIAILDQQKKELIEIKGSLETKVKERTTDLMNLNERLLFQNNQLEQYAYITSHNLRAPIAQIKGLVHLLPITNKFDELTEETLNRLHDSALGMEKVFADLSTILNVKNSIQKPWEEVDVINEITAIVGSLMPSIKEKNIELILPQNKVFLVKALRPYVYSILHNLIDNAIKYSDSEKIDSVIKLEFSETAKYHKVAVIDNGIGIDMDMASGKVFQMYQRFNNTHPGQGFGLFLVKSQMEAMGGSVELESIKGQGSTFNLYFAKN